MKQSLLFNGILVDISEPEEIFKEVSAKANAVRKRLDVGDYVVGDFIIERKSGDDFMSSITDGRLFSQVERMLKHGKAILLLEGKPTRMETSLKCGVLARLLVKGISLVCTESREETTTFIVKLGEKILSEEKTKEVIAKKPKDPYEQKLFVLKSIPGVGDKLAKELLERFGSIKAIAEADIRELEAVEKLGKKKAKKIKEILG